jgi:hypothetical protein
MVTKRSIAALLVVSTLGLVVVLASDENALQIQHAECTFFGPDHDKFVQAATRGFRDGRPIGPPREYKASTLTEAVVASLPPPPPGTRTGSLIDPATTNTIDRYLFQAMAQANVTPAPATTDYEFVRRVTLDLNGRIPTAAQVTSFVNDSSPDKRSKYIETLLSSPEWADKWTMYYGDFLQNNSRNTQIVRFAQGVTAFNSYIRSSLTSNKPYNQMAREIISATGTDSYTQGELNWLVGGVVTGGPQQDIWDQQTANIADTFLGIAHVNCLLCHSGRGHLDSLSLWGSQTSRQQAWALSSFLSRTDVPRTTVSQNVYYWGLADNTRFKTDYPLNTTTGNRPARQPIGTTKNMAPSYLFGSQAASSGQNYRVALAQFVTSDFQFARAAVNFMWAQFFGMGIVDPPDQFDPNRLDPSHPLLPGQPIQPRRGPCSLPILNC